PILKLQSVNKVQALIFSLYSIDTKTVNLQNLLKFRVSWENIQEQTMSEMLSWMEAAESLPEHVAKSFRPGFMMTAIFSQKRMFF
ncbi:MAG TPA: hypothetical protein VK861_05785, partial [Bacteroidales bacterium]|nr:hypothetical protein [Bacteroidales bacterium]